MAYTRHSSLKPVYYKRHVNIVQCAPLIFLNSNLLFSFPNETEVFWNSVMVANHHHGEKRHKCSRNLMSTVRGIFS